MELTLRTLNTARLMMIAATRDLVIADLEGSAVLASVLKAEVPSNWPPELYERSAMEFALRQLQDPAEQGWSFWYILTGDDEKPELCGLCGFKGRPNNNGSVEIGYSILAQYRSRGIATEAAGALIGWAFNHLVVREVSAETLPHLIQSIRVMEKNGLTHAGPGSEHGVIRYAVQRPDS